MQFIGWVAPSCIYTDTILNGIVNKLQCSMFCVEKDYEQGNCLCNNLHFKLEIQFIPCTSR